MFGPVATGLRRLVEKAEAYNRSFALLSGRDGSATTDPLPRVLAVNRFPLLHLAFGYGVAAGVIRRKGVPRRAAARENRSVVCSELSLRMPDE